MNKDKTNTNIESKTTWTYTSKDCGFNIFGEDDEGVIIVDETTFIDEVLFELVDIIIDKMKLDDKYINNSNPYYGYRNRIYFIIKTKLIENLSFEKIEETINKYIDYLDNEYNDFIEREKIFNSDLTFNELFRLKVEKKFEQNAMDFNEYINCDNEDDDIEEEEKYDDEMCNLIKKILNIKDKK